VTLDQLAQQRRHGHKRLVVPPTKIASVPLSAWGMLPETGASSICAPSAATRWARCRGRPRLTVLNVDVDLRPEPGEDAVEPGGDRTECAVVGDHAEDDVGRGGHLTGRFAPLQAALDQRLGLRLGPVGAVDVMARVEQAPAMRLPIAPSPTNPIALIVVPPSISATSSSVSSRLAAVEDGVDLGRGAGSHDRAVDGRCAASTRRRWHRRGGVVAIRDRRERATSSRLREIGSRKRRSSLRQSSAGSCSIRARVISR